MSAKILPALALGLLVGTTALASAQTANTQRDLSADLSTARDLYTPVVERGMPYYWADPYYGTPYENVAPYTGYGQPDPYRGSRFDNVAPY
jgi:hypothetical protein